MTTKAPIGSIWQSEGNQWLVIAADGDYRTVERIVDRRPSGDTYRWHYSSVLAGAVRIARRRALARSAYITSIKGDER